MLLQLKVHLQTTKKGSQSISEYFAKMEGILEALLLAGYCVGFGDEYFCWIAS